MRQLEEDDPFFLADLYKQYFSFDTKPVLTGEEQNWVNEHGAIRIGYLKDEPGVSVMDQSRGKRAACCMTTWSTRMTVWEISIRISSPSRWRAALH